MTLDEFNAAADDDGFALLAQCCGSRRWAEKVLRRRPFANRQELLRAAEQIWNTLEPEDWFEAFRAHPQIGDLESLQNRFAATAHLAGAEQGAVTTASVETLKELKNLNAAYERKFGFIFIICATGKSADEMLASLKARLGNPFDKELKVACEEQAKITKLRLEKFL